ncbi:MAG TPA: hypothetical protein VK712_03225 [Verrucomicrobiae bacterium]|jgi:ATP phosphoribosyltransferase|nr:hypothetical protein [Verrucomicrobiae bacterium]
MPLLLLRSRASLGFMGSDKFNELDSRTQEQLQFAPLIQTNIEFILATLSPRASRLDGQIASGEDLTIATTYPKKSRWVAAKLGCGIREIVPLNGAVESVQLDDPSIDGIVEVMDSGDTLRDNSLSIVVRDLGFVAIGAVWKREGN